MEESEKTYESHQEDTGVVFAIQSPHKRSNGVGDGHQRSESAKQSAGEISAIGNDAQPQHEAGVRFKEDSVHRKDVERTLFAPWDVH